MDARCCRGRLERPGDAALDSRLLRPACQAAQVPVPDRPLGAVLQNVRCGTAPPTCSRLARSEDRPPMASRAWRRLLTTIAGSTSPVDTMGACRHGEASQRPLGMPYKNASKNTAHGQRDKSRIRVRLSSCSRDLMAPGQGYLHVHPISSNAPLCAFSGTPHDDASPALVLPVKWCHAS